MMSSIEVPACALRVGEWVALGLRSGRCPVGVVTHRFDTTVVLDLLDYSTGRPMDYPETHELVLVQSWAVAPVVGEPTRDELCILWQFQNQWTEFGLYRSQDPDWEDEQVCWYRRNGRERVDILRDRLIVGKALMNIGIGEPMRDREDSNE